MADQSKQIIVDIIRGYVCARGRLETADEIRAWFAEYEALMEQYKIAEGNLLRLDISGFQIGTLGNLDGDVIFSHTDEWVSIFECVCADGTVFEPVIKFRWFTFIRKWRKSATQSWRVISIETDKHFTELLIEWLIKTFDDASQSGRSEEYRLLIVDGHRAEGCETFDSECRKRKTIPIFTPKNFSYLFHELNISSAGAIENYHLTQIRKQLVKVKNRDRVRLIYEYAEARSETLTP